VELWQFSPVAVHCEGGAGEDVETGGLGDGLVDGLGDADAVHESPVATGHAAKQDGIDTTSPLSRVTEKDALPVLPSVFADQVAPLTRLI